ncbi:tRNA (adenosine(37)-N6)-threonylcarbamoyltransferase complex transferase subunit TsaD [Mycoplasmopsis arginini]|uniref:tRNA N6-adenosine threonylcarbamoyltransferase n=1 Tax=Mycoplasmopsis arginini TaxID=2094 RepID=A0AA43U090_MYCAR|nr:tRNA (adenosine(37)-N6)-threonylcarbamoyltransferase complex transferase subunit TsaD [Mycoplasmopsis arginini]MCY2903066.1 tRNA (adenosine(37)-N6)-threonylcarbamoyltransferase complex transferase subunit TsaD [Mycoplasmopsis arginini QMP CG1-2758]MDI3348565.1 tRNA (adenosine(37)-N6)-threonylcarbamoyltransferase complex transferase subunit TsaD [Mycoplasmopsis arginini]MDI3348623.1 tRNA (adenosine(37)-N6)-threonylcarbamoyltransferase complex transferase subunit TsaD [Mycoplasmopsis arginini]
MKIFAIESSHDDTSFAILEDNKPIWMKTISQTEIHKKYGGTIPEIASRLHVKNSALLIEEFKNVVINNKNIFQDIDYIAYTKEPGLVGSLQIGYVVAQTMARIYSKPILGLNHLEGHFYSAFIEKELEFPALCLLVSGGHSQIMLYNDKDNFEIIGETQDDAVGEVYDKVARKLNLGFPGGPCIDKIWQENNEKYLGHFSIPHTDKELDFSFSGIKTAVINHYNNLINRKEEINIKKIATEFQNTIILYLKNNFEKAILKFAPKCITLAGGVSANKAIRNMVLSLHQNVYLPKMEYTTDNAMMIARLAFEKVRK